MASESKRRAIAKYNDKTYDQILVRVRKGDKEKISAAAEAAGMSLNGFITAAIERLMEQISRDKGI